MKVTPLSLFFLNSLLGCFLWFRLQRKSASRNVRVYITLRPFILLLFIHSLTHTFTYSASVRGIVLQSGPCSRCQRCWSERSSGERQTAGGGGLYSCQGRQVPWEKAAGKEAGGAGRGGRVVKDGRGRLAEKLAPENEGGEERCRPREQKVLRPRGTPLTGHSGRARQQQRRSEERRGRCASHFKDFCLIL